MNRFMPRFTQKDLINLFLGKITKKRGRTGSRLDMPVQRGEPVRAALVHLTIPLVGFSNLLKKFKIQNIAIFTAFPKKITA